MITILVILNLLIFAAKAAAHSPRFLMAKRINHGLAHTPMRGLGFEFEAAGHRYHLHPAFMAAVAGTESGFGVAACSNNHFNVWGLASCNQSWSVPYWRSWREAIFWYGAFLKSHWPSARTTYDYGGYAACSSCWGSKTAYWMRSRFGVGPGVRYP